MSEALLPPIYAFAIIMLLSGILQSAEAQDQVEIRCGEAASYPKVIPGFVGRYYYVAEWGQGDADVRAFGVITAQGEEQIPLSLTPDVARTVGSPFISPDGTKIAFAPFRLPHLIVWDTVSGETAAFELPQELAGYLSDMDDSPDPAAMHFNKIIWPNASELWIQYFDESYFPPFPAQQLKLSVLEHPLRLIAQTPPEAIDLGAPNVLYQASLISPKQNYTLQVQLSPSVPGAQEIRITDPQTNAVAFSAQSSDDTRIVGEPVWSRDGTAFFYTAVVPSGVKLVQVNVDQAFTQDTWLDTALEKRFGTSTGVSTDFPPTLSPDGTSLGFGYLDQGNNQPYVVRYNVETGEIIAVCDEQRPSSDIYAFWSPSSRFIAYWYGGTVKVYDFETGNRYILPGAGFAGWIP